MQRAMAEELLAASAAVPGQPDQELLRDLLTFIDQRLSRARQCIEALAGAVGIEAQQAELHALVRECWDALDGVGRVVNACLYPIFPDVGLYPVGQQMRQCTFYTVRRALHSHPLSAQHAVSRLLWDETCETIHPAYARLSLLRHLAAFVPIPLSHGKILPGWDDLPQHLAGAVRAQPLCRCELVEGCEEIAVWTAGLVQRCSEELIRSLAQ